VGWDTLERRTYRHRSFPDYQGGRQFDDELLAQFRDLRAFVKGCGFANARAAGYEADDFLAAAAAAEERRHGTALIASGDRDTFQLASERTTILFPARAGAMLRLGPAEVRERYGIEPHQVPDFIALRGDPSDRLPGAPGVGSKGAAELLRKHDTLEALLKAGRFADQAERLRLFRMIATMDRKAPLPSLADQTPMWRKAAALASRWGLNQLTGRLQDLAAEQARGR
jgi:DNA polymerase-1